MLSSLTLADRKAFTLAPSFQESVAWLPKGIQNLPCDLHSGNWKASRVKHSKLHKYTGLIPVP